MENSLKKHVLSEYASINEFEVFQQESSLVSPTILTENIEISDPDEFVMKDPTYLTHSIENSDPDEFRVTQNTVETRAIETSDPDEMLMGPTKSTYSIESSDSDEFLLIVGYIILLNAVLIYSLEISSYF